MCLSESCVLVRAESGVCPTTVQLRMGLSLGPTSVDMKAETSTLASNTPSISFRRKQRPSAHLSHRSLWTSPSTVSFQDSNHNKLKWKNKHISMAYRCKTSVLLYLTYSEGKTAGRSVFQRCRRWRLETHMVQPLPPLLLPEQKHRLPGQLQGRRREPLGGKHQTWGVFTLNSLGKLFLGTMH